MSVALFYVGPLFAAHATCSVSMVLLNKTIAQGFDFPWTVLFIQNIGTVLLGYLYPIYERIILGRTPPTDVEKLESGGTTELQHQKILGMKVPIATKNKLWVLLQVVFFMATLFTSLKALRYISVPLYVVARNTVPAQTAVLERVFTGVKQTPISTLGLLCTIIGAVVYTYGDLTSSGLDFTGLIYAVLLTLIVAGCSVVDKTAVRILSAEEGYKPVECNQLRVAVSLPLNILFMMLFEFVSNNMEELNINLNSPTKIDIYESTANMTTPVIISLLLSTVFGFGMGTFNFYLQQAVNAATVQIANILYKLTTTIISRFSHPAPVSFSSWVGFALSLIGIALYTFGPKILLALFPPTTIDPDKDAVDLMNESSSGNAIGAPANVELEDKSVERAALVDSQSDKDDLDNRTPKRKPQPGE